MGKNKLAKFAEMESFPHVVQMTAREIQANGHIERKGTWNALFFKNDNPIVLELGCGKGEYTVELARRFPATNFIGVDIKGARMWTGAKESHEAGLENVGFLRTNIEMIHHFFGPDEVSEIWLTFPDPQMKKVNKRLTSTNFMRLYQQFLKDKGLIHLKTDSNFMFAYTREMVKVNAYDMLTCTDDLYASPIQDPMLQVKTYYEQQWLERGISIKYLQFLLKHKTTLMEPDIEIEHDSYRSFGRSKRHLVK